ncbi:MAG: hypothetical protein V7K27_34125 [Nostoc sp.]|uniref:hypothetical protein n=1 Tax=Nostoc sp. TaxID=1180 RepID=UPI002FF71774
MTDKVNFDDEDDSGRGGYAPKKENQQSAKQKVDNAVKEAGLDERQRRKLHDQLGQDYMDYHEILEIARQIKRQDEED